MNEPREVNQPGEVNQPEMDQLESQLRNALAREDAPEGFEARVRAAAAAQPEPEPRSWWQRLSSHERLRWASAAAVVVVMIGGGAVWQREQARERAEGELAKARLQLALQITGQKLRQIQDRVRGPEKVQNVREN